MRRKQVAMSTSETELSKCSAQKSQRQCHHKQAGASSASTPTLVVSIVLAVLEPCPRMEMIWGILGGVRQAICELGRYLAQELPTKVACSKMPKNDM